MAEEFQENDDRTEDATPERREEFRERGQVAVSREVTSVLVLASCVAFLTLYSPYLFGSLKHLLISNFQKNSTYRVDATNFSSYSADALRQMLFIMIPAVIVASIAAIAGTLLQTRFNWSWQKLKPDFNRIDPISGFGRLFSMQSAVELFKGVWKMVAVGIVAYAILKNEWIKVPGLLNFSVAKAWGYWGSITQYLFWSVSMLLLVMAGLDYFYNFITLEKKLKMTKQELREEMKRREGDPHIKARIKRMQRDIANRRMVDATRKATVIITNPTHFSVALKYELGMAAPILVAKGQDFLALRMREVAKENSIPIVENKPLARTLYKLVEVGQEIPDTLYKAVSEVIRYVFKLKGIKIGKKAA